MIHARRSKRRRGAALSESAIVLSLFLMLILGSLSVGLGVVQQQELSWLAQECARYAAVHGPTYQAEQSGAAPTSQSLMTNVIAPKSGLLTTNNITCTVTMTNGVAAVKLTYAWTPPVYISPITFQSSSSIPITY
jgi:Flp pilus assembly protein TadG